MSEHTLTPGPWSVNTHPHFNNGKPGTIWGSEGPGYGAVCNMSPIYPHDFNEANARLIAAAPDLLEACKELVDLMEAVREDGYKPDSFTTQPAKAAISKAETQ